MNYQSDCLCGGECQKPCIAIKQIQEDIKSQFVIEQLNKSVDEVFKAGLTDLSNREIT